MGKGNAMILTGVEPASSSMKRDLSHRPLAVIPSKEYTLRYAIEPSNEGECCQGVPVRPHIVGYQRGLGQGVSSDKAEDVKTPVTHIDNVSKTDVRPGRACIRYECRWILDVIAMFINILGLGVAKDNTRISVQAFNTLHKVVLPDKVVVGRPLEILAPGQFKGEIEVSCRPYVFYVPVIADPLIKLCIVFTKLFGIVCGCVVTNNDFKICIRLVQQRLNGLREISLTIVDRESYSNFRVWRGHFP
jgi:hypothetical protein